MRGPSTDNNNKRSLLLRLKLSFIVNFKTIKKKKDKSLSKNKNSFLIGLIFLH